MTWCDHVEAISSKINQRIAILKRIRHLLPVEMRSMLYNSLILLLFYYADTSWGDKFNATLMEDLQLLQNKVAKIILDLPSFSSSTQTLEALGWQTLAKRRLLRRCVLIYKYVNGLIDFYFDIPRNSNIHSYNTRNRNNFYLPRVRRNYGKQRIFLSRSCRMEHFR